VIGHGVGHAHVVVPVPERDHDHGIDNVPGLTLMFQALSDQHRR
jgi:hypothetical protein